MSCRKYRKFIELDDILNEKQIAHLRRHLQTCCACARLFAQRAKFRQKVAAVRDVAPKMRSAENLTQKIMTAIHNTSRDESTRAREAWFYLQPRLRLALVGVVVILMNVLVAQEAFIGYRIRQWEQNPPKGQTVNKTLAQLCDRSLLLRSGVVDAQNRTVLSRIEENAPKIAAFMRQTRPEYTIKDIEEIKARLSDLAEVKAVERLIRSWDAVSVDHKIVKRLSEYL